MNSRQTNIATAVCCSVWFGVLVHIHAASLPHLRCNARILYLHPITDDQLPALFAPRRDPKILDMNQPIAPDTEQEPGVNVQARLGTDRFIGPTRRVVDLERVIALQFLRRQQFIHAARAKTRVVPQPQPLNDRPRSGRQVGEEVTSDHLGAEDTGEPNWLSWFTTEGLPEIPDK